MTQKIHSCIFIIALFAFITFPQPVEATVQETTIDQWLALGPMPIPNAEVSLLGTEKNILKFNHLPIDALNPNDDGAVEWPGHLEFKWKPIQSIGFQASSHQILYLATFIETQRWLQTNLYLKGIDTPFIVYLNGEAQKTTKTTDGESWESPLTLTTGKHALIIKLSLKKDNPANASVSLRTKETFGKDQIKVTIDPTSPLTTKHILNAVQVSHVAVSPNGSAVAVAVKRTSPENGTTKKWLKILSVATGKSVFSSRNLGNIQNFRWLRDSRHFSYITTGKSKSSLFLYDMSTHKQEPLLTNILNFNDYDWAPDNSFLIYSVYSKDEGNGIYKHIEDIEGRASFAGYRYSMYLFFPKGKATHKISGEDLNFRTAKISPDSKRALLIKTVEDTLHRPYFKNVASLLNTTDLSRSELFQGSFVNAMTWAPDSKRLLILGGPSAFEGIGKTIPPDVIANDYDNQAFIFDIATQNVQAISKNFNPSIESAFWHPIDNAIYFRVTEKANGSLYRYLPKTDKYTRLDTKVDVVGSLSFAQNRNLAVYWGSGVSNPHKLYT